MLPACAVINTQYTCAGCDGESSVSVTSLTPYNGNNAKSERTSAAKPPQHKLRTHIRINTATHSNQSNIHKNRQEKPEQRATGKESGSTFGVCKTRPPYGATQLPKSCTIIRVRTSRGYTAPNSVLLPSNRAIARGTGSHQTFLLHRSERAATHSSPRGRRS